CSALRFNLPRRFRAVATGHTIALGPLVVEFQSPSEIQSGSYRTSGVSQILNGMFQSPSEIQSGSYFDLAPVRLHLVKSFNLPRRFRAVATSAWPPFPVLQMP